MVVVVMLNVEADGSISCLILCQASHEEVFGNDQLILDAHEDILLTIDRATLTYIQGISG